MPPALRSDKPQKATFEFQGNTPLTLPATLNGPNDVILQIDVKGASTSVAQTGHQKRF